MHSLEKWLATIELNIKKHEGASHVYIVKNYGKIFGTTKLDCLAALV